MQAVQDASARSSGGAAVQIGGFGAAFRVSGADTGGAYAVVEHTLAPGSLGAAPHRHANEDEVSYVLEGTLTAQLGDQIVTAGPGEFVRKQRGQFHTFWNAGSAPLRFLEIISPAGFEHYFEELAALVPSDGPPDMAALGALARRYGLELDLSAVPALMQEHNVRLG